MEVNEFINLIANVGFPVAVTSYLLIRLEKQLMGLTASLSNLNSIISAKLGKYIGTEDQK